MLHIQAGIQHLLSWQNLLLIAIISLLSGALSGAYPAFFLSALQPVAILKNQKKGFRINLDFRKALIVLQFTISIILIIATIVINKQLYLLNNMQLGFNKDYLLVLSSGRFPKDSQAFKNELLQNSHIKAVTVSDWMIGEKLREETTASDSNSAANSFTFTSINADFDFIKTMQLKLLAGRDFSESYSFDIINRDSMLSHQQNLTEAQKNAIVLSMPVILSESAVSKLQLKNPVGKVLNTGNIKGTVIGVIKNFEGTSLRQQMQPVILYASPSNGFGYTYIRIAPDNITYTLQFIRDTYQKLMPYQNFELSFADERLQQLYTSESRLASLFSVFAGLAIVIACMGLFSLIAFIVQQRTKEIGIRKVMGASVYNIAKLLTIDFVRLVIVSLLIASPIAWWAMHKWLENYAHKIIISWWMFLIAGVLAILITLITVSFQAIKAALSNPVKSLRSE
ncbi:MAG: FtsX-like permease family protein [Segetibacter sp.]